MTVRTRGGRFMLDIRHHHEDGRVERIRIAVPQDKQSRRAAEAYERTVLADLRAGIDPRRPVAQEPALERAPTIADYAATYLRQQTRDAGLKASTYQSKQRLLDKWIVPRIGARRIDAVRTADFTTLRSAMADAGREPKTINNALGVLSSLVKFWHGQHDRPVPHFTTGRVKMDRGRRPKFFADDEVARMAVAASLRPDVLALVLLGVDAGLRMSECRALQWSDLQLGDRPTITVSRTREDGEGDGDEDEEPPPKGWKSRTLKLTPRLAAALGALPRHIRDPHLFLDRWGEPLTRRMVARRFEAALRGAAISRGTYHWTRHTFCTRLAMRGVPARTIQELAGHADLATTQRYMWCSPASADAAIDALVDGAAHFGHTAERRTENAS